MVNTSVVETQLNDNCHHNTHSRETAPLYNKPPNFKRYLIISILWFTVIFLLAKNFATSYFWIVIVSVYLFSVPIVLCGIYINTIKQIRQLNLFAKRGWMFKFFSSRPLKIVLWICWALVTSFFILVQFCIYSQLDWLCFFFVIPVFWFVFKIIQKLISHEFKPYLVCSTALSWSRILCPIIMIIIYFILHFSFDEVTVYPSIQDAVNSKKAVVSNMTGSAIIQEVSQYLAFYEGLKIYVIGRFDPLNKLLPMVIFSICNFIVFYNACVILSCFLVPAVEYRRMFGHLSDTDQPQAVSVSHRATITAIIVFLTLFIYLPSFTYIELYFLQTPELSKNRQKLELYTIQKLEKIDDVFFKEGTIAQLQNAKIKVLHNAEIALAHLEGQADRAFDRLEVNVDHYLDWYYSLVGEYTRIASLLVGELEDYMVKKLEESLRQGDSFKEVETSINRVFSKYENIQKLYKQTTEEIMKKNRVVKKDSSFQVVQKSSLDDILHLPIHQDMIKLKHRLLGGGVGGAAAGVLTAVVVKKIVGKVLGKSLIKLAAKALSKVVISKTAGTVAGAGAGTAIGATVGSIVPVLGTTICAVVGGIVGGIIVGVSVDKLLIELEESFSREDFKQEILSEINDARIKFKAQFRG